MHRFLIVAIAALAVAITGASAAPAQKPPKPPKPTPAPTTPYAGITIKASQNPVVFPSGVTFTGKVDGAKAGVRVILQRATAATGPFTNRAAVNTDNAGRYSVGDRPLRNHYYRVVSSAPNAATSAPLLVRVRMLVGLRVSDSTPRRGALVRFSGTVRPRHNGRTVYVQKRSRTGRFVTVKRTTLRARDTSSSRYSVRVRVRSSGVYRTKVLGHNDHATGFSRTRSLVVH